MYTQCPQLLSARTQKHAVVAEHLLTAFITRPQQRLGDPTMPFALGGHTPTNTHIASTLQRVRRRQSKISTAVTIVAATARITVRVTIGSHTRHSTGHGVHRAQGRVGWNSRAHAVTAVSHARGITPWHSVNVDPSDTVAEADSGGRRSGCERRTHHHRLHDLVHAYDSAPMFDEAAAHCHDRRWRL